MTKTTGIDSYLGFAVRANKAVFGLESLLRMKDLPEVVLYDEGLGNSAKRKAQFFCDKKNVAFLEVSEGYLNETLKRNNVKIVAVSDKSLGEQITRRIALGIICIFTGVFLLVTA